MSARRPLVLYEPRGPGRRLPIELLLAAARVDDRAVEIVDGRLEVAPEGRVVELCREAALLVVAAPSGPALLDAQRISRAARAARPDLFVLWMGEHATARPGECLRAGADASAVGPAEHTLPELLGLLDAGLAADRVPGLVLDDAGRERSTGLRADFGPPPTPARFDRLDLERHFRWCGERRLPCRSSRVAREANRSPAEWRWAGVAAEAVVAEVTEWVACARATGIDFVDEEFFADLRRAEAIARGLCAAGVRASWTARGRVETLRLLTEDAVLALRQAGCERVRIEVASGSAGARALWPGAPDEAAVVELAHKLARGGLPARWEFVVGRPGEPRDALFETYRFARRLHRVAAGSETPIALWRPRAAGLGAQQGPGVPEPAEVAGWAAAETREPEWIAAPVRRWARRFDFYLRWAHQRPDRGLGRWVIHFLARLRVATGVYGLDVERGLVELSRRVRTANKAARPGSIGWEP